jgi:tetratricopeptide (TPR) repeat protein
VPLSGTKNVSDISEIADKITVKIEGPVQGSGVIVKRYENEYTILTSWHVVKNINADENFIVNTSDGKQHSIDSATISRIGQVDLASISFKSSNEYKVASLGDVENVKSGNPIYVSGYPLPTVAVPVRIRRFLEGKVIANASVEIPNGYQLLYSNPTIPGMSGGSVLNAQGKLVGIHGQGETDAQLSEQSGIAIKTGTNQAVPITHYISTTSNISKANFFDDALGFSISSDDYIVLAESKLGVEGDEEKVIELSTMAIQKSPSALSYFLRAYAKDDLGDSKGAISDYSQALKYSPNDSMILNNRGLVRYGLEDYKGAIADYSKAIALDSSHELAYDNRGLARQGLEDYKGAIADHSKAINIDPNNALAYANRGLARAGLEDYKGAIADHSEAIELDPSNGVDYWNRGDSKFTLEQFRGAIDDYTKAIELFVDDPHSSIYTYRGISYENTGDLESACSDWKRAFEIGDEDAGEWVEDQCR